MIYTDYYPSFGEDDKEALRILVRKVRRSGCRVLEIGSWLGSGSTKVIIEELASTEGSRLYCVDTWKGSPNVVRHQEIVAQYDVFGTFRHNVILAGGDAFVCPLLMSSECAAEIIVDGFFDLVFIDGDHSYASTRNDIALWRNKIRNGGILCGHDCECRPNSYLRDTICAARDLDHIAGTGTPFAVIHPGVVLAVNEAFGDAANLWAERPLSRPDGTNGRPTLWDVVLPVLAGKAASAFESP
jgi:predicted O-methyltransferase YrrM